MMPACSPGQEVPKTVKNENHIFVYMAGFDSTCLMLCILKTLATVRHFGSVTRVLLVLRSATSPPVR